MKMIYKTTSGEEIRFDDFHKSTDNSEKPWAAICSGCRAKYVKELKEASVSIDTLEKGIIFKTQIPMKELGKMTEKKFKELKISCMQRGVYL